MTRFRDRLGGAAEVLPRPALCDAWTADSRRFGDEWPGLTEGAVLGRWPDELETEAATSLACALGDEASWDALAAAPAVVQRIAERARLQPLDFELLRHLPHLQHVCHRPRLYLRVEEERLPVSRARRTPVRAVADLVSHPGDWEHRTLRSIQPSRVLARQIDDEWDLYENRVAVRLVDHLLAYVARRLAELLQVEKSLRAHKDNVEEGTTSFRRARRIMKLWADALDARIEDDLRATRRRLEHAQRDLQALVDAPLYQRVPRRAKVALALMATNILVNDTHYRKVAALWRAWVKYGHKRQETREQRAARRQSEALAWDRFVFHLVVRAFTDLSWSAAPGPAGWTLSRSGHVDVDVAVDDNGVIVLRAERATLRLLPLCASFAASDDTQLLEQLRAWDRLGELVGVYVQPLADRTFAGDGADAVHLPVGLTAPDRASGWSFGGRATLLGCSPWGIDSEERLARLLNGWLHRATVHRYPVHEKLRDLPHPPAAWRWVRFDGLHLVALQAPEAYEQVDALAWCARQQADVEAQVQLAKLTRQAVTVAPLDALTTFRRFVEQDASVLESLDACPVCSDKGRVEPRPGKQPDGSDATWWASCATCKSEWGLRPCTSCGARFRALMPAVGLDLSQVATNTSVTDWPDKVLGRDAWAQPCRQAPRQFRCPNCGKCQQGSCGRCGPRG
ncbi:hypothetical protein OV090_12515 [Nannocystis sp. RBIL2]|uniref:hypothetical protein n=1 Tax=Nannocystis sp. RBIL2 TaxID=2996788 RepID=UPI0022714C07|nr:hypothetical protein [Nannocystis sp. RBIL2]MCY1065595.1 hypothetical protein [Nannocystis sp. RBIL2]